MKVRLDKLLVLEGLATRSQAADLVRRGVVRSKGEPLRSPAQKVDPQEILWEGEPLDPLELYLLFHKPAACVCTRSEEEGRTIYDYLPARWARRIPPLVSVGRLDRDTTGLLFLTDQGDLNHALVAPKKHVAKLYRVALERPLREEGRTIYDYLPARWARRIPPLVSVGRLDRDTTGLLFLTDQGDLNHALVAPKKHVAKLYRVALERPLREEEAESIRRGGGYLEGDPKPLLPAPLKIVAEREVELTLYEGRYHQIKRLFGGMGNKVLALHRLGFGPWKLGDLGVGEWRMLSKVEVESALAEERS